MARFFLVVCLGFIPATVLADIEPGNWEITARTEVQGVADASAFTQTHCLKAEDAGDPARIFGSSGTSCEFLNRRDTGSLITFEVACGTQPQVRGSGSVRYARDSLEGDLELKLADFSTRSRITGRRLGGC